MRAAMIWAVVLSLVALSYASYESIRARYYPGIGAVASLAYVSLARLASLLPPYPGMPLRDTLAEIWWLYPALFFALSFGPMVFAYLGARDLPEDDPRREPLARVGLAFLANVLLGAALLVIVAVGLLLVAGDA